MVKSSGAREQAARDLQVAVSDALSSVHKHAYGNSVGSFRVEAKFDAGAWVILIEDEGSSSLNTTIPVIRSFSKWRKRSPIVNLVDEFTMHLNPLTGRLIFRMRKAIIRP